MEKWDSLLPLPDPYVVLGGRFPRSLLLGQLFHHALGLAESGHWDKVEDMVANFAAEIDTWGHIPNGNRTYYLQPFAALLLLYGKPAGDARWRPVLKTYQPQLEKEYRYWMVRGGRAGTRQRRQTGSADGGWRAAQPLLGR